MIWELRTTFIFFIWCLRLDSPWKFTQVGPSTVQPIRNWLSQIHYLNICFSQSRKGKNIHVSIIVLTWYLLFFFLLPHCIMSYALSIRISCVSIFSHCSPLQCIFLDQFYHAISILSLLIFLQILCLFLRIRYQM